MARESRLARIADKGSKVVVTDGLGRNRKSLISENDIPDSDEQNASFEERKEHKKGMAWFNNVVHARDPDKHHQKLGAMMAQLLNKK